MEMSFIVIVHDERCPVIPQIDCPNCHLQSPAWRIDCIHCGYLTDAEAKSDREVNEIPMSKLIMFVPRIEDHQPLRA